MPLDHSGPDEIQVTLLYDAYASEIQVLLSNHILFDDVDDDQMTLSYDLFEGAWVTRVPLPLPLLSLYDPVDGQTCRSIGISSFYEDINCVMALFIFAHDNNYCIELYIEGRTTDMAGSTSQTKRQSTQIRYSQQYTATRYFFLSAECRDCNADDEYVFVRHLPVSILINLIEPNVFFSHLIFLLIILFSAIR